MVQLSPFVYWAQTESSVSLVIDLKNVSDPQINVIDQKISFFSEGVGAQGRNNYSFALDLYSSVAKVKEDGSGESGISMRVLESKIELVLQKSEYKWWPRLTAQPQKPAWLKINFEQWRSEEAEDSSEEAERRDVMQDYPGMYDRLHKQEMGYKKEDLRKVYLIVYNLLQFVGFTFVLAVMGARYAKLGEDSIPGTYDHVGSAFKFLHLMQFLEVMHPLFGYTKGGVLVPFLQVSGRALVLFGMIESEPRMQTKPVVFYLFLVWAVVEIIRYPYYISQLIKAEIYFLTWLRYSIWIPLYPLGILCESIVILRNIPYFEETQRFTISLPNSWNFAFHMPTFMRIHLMILSIPGLYFLMSHMHRMRNVKLKPKVVIKKCK